MAVSKEDIFLAEEIDILVFLVVSLLVKVQSRMSVLDVKLVHIQLFWGSVHRGQQYSGVFQREKFPHFLRVRKFPSNAHMPP